MTDDESPQSERGRMCKWCGKHYVRSNRGHPFKCRSKVLKQAADERAADEAIAEWQRLDALGQTQKNKYSNCPHASEPWFHEDCSVCLSRGLRALGKIIAMIARSDLMAAARRGHQLEIEIEEGVGFTSSYWPNDQKTCITFRSWRQGETRRVATIKGPCEATAAKVLNRLLRLADAARGRTNHR